MSPDTDTVALLQRYRPVLQYDSQESFYADSAAIITDLTVPGSTRCNYLKNAAGKILAAGKPKAGQAQLKIEFLTAPKYATGVVAKRDDYLDETGRDYVADAGQMHIQPGYADQIYGHAVTDDHGRIWLQYWFFHYYNNKALFGIGLHEGDWEMIQIRLDPQNKPNVVTYAQHRDAARCAWTDVEREPTPDGPVPVVYSARGSHASYFRPGIYREAPVVPDYNDAKGPRVRPDVVVISDRSPSWARWPGRWGSTPKRNFFESDSPRGPRERDQWNDPAGFHASARPAPRGILVQADAALRAAPFLPPTPRIVARREGARAVIGYRIPKPTRSQLEPVGLLVSVDAPGDIHPPASYSFQISALTGEIEHPLELEARPYEVRASAFSQNGLESAIVTTRLAT